MKNGAFGMPWIDHLYKMGDSEFAFGILETRNNIETMYMNIWLYSGCPNNHFKTCFRSLGYVGS